VQGEQLEGYPELKRFKSGEYRCIYRVDAGEIVLLVLRIGKRNDGEVYKNLGHIEKTLPSGSSASIQTRHCERSEAIHFCLPSKHVWIAASLRSSR